MGSRDPGNKTLDSDRESSLEVGERPVIDSDELIYLVDDQGIETAHELLHVMTLGRKSYAALLAAFVDPMDPEKVPQGLIQGDPIHLSFWRILQDPSGEEFLQEIQDKKEGKRVARAWLRYLKARGSTGGVV